MRSTEKGAYARSANALLGKCKAKPKRTIWFNGHHVTQGTKSIHRTPIAQRWRTFWRIKSAMKEQQP